MNFDVPFYANTPDNTHCFQAGIKSVLKFFEPEQEYSWKELEDITAKVEGLWTWPIATMLWLSERDYQIIVKTTFNYREFASKGNDYLVERMGEKVAKAQIEHSNITQEQKLAEQLLTKVKVENEVPNFYDIRSLINEGFIVTCNVNSRALNNLDGYSGHFIVVKGYDDNGFYIHDPGPPPIANRYVTDEQYDKGWAYPTKESRDILAIKKRQF